MPNVYGIDISNNEGTVDLSSLKTQGYDYIYLKATEGTTVQDQYMNQYYEQAKAAGLKVGAYHFLTGTSSPVTQAQNFYNTIKDKEWDLIPILDDERDFGDNISDYTEQFISTFNQLCPWKLGLYSYTSFINEHFTNIADTIKDMPLWVADYTGSAWKYGQLDISFSNMVGHQYSETGSVGGINIGCDLDVFTDGILLDSSDTSGTWVPGTGTNVGKWWYELADKTYPSNCWKKISGKWYLFDKDGWMIYDWKQDGGVWYFLGDSTDGSMKTGWQLINGKWYYFNNDGQMQTGWVKYNDKWYYMDNSGAMCTGWIVVSEKDYLLDSNGVMYQDTTAYGYSFDSNGVATKQG